MAGAYLLASGDVETIEQLLNQGETTNPDVWNLFEFVLIVVQIVAAVLVLTLAKDEQPPVWIIGYTCGCIAFLPVICWRFCRCIFSVSDTCMDQVMNVWESVVEWFFVAWFVFIVWHLTDFYTSIGITTQHTWLCIVFLVYSFFRYVWYKLRCSDRYKVSRRSMNLV